MIVLTLFPLEERRSSVGVNGLSGDEAAIIANQKQHRGSNFIHHSLAANGDVRGIGRTGLRVPLQMFPGGVDAAR